MIVHPDPAPGKAGGAPTHNATPDERLGTFADLLRAVDRGDFRAGILATRRLRKLGISVVLTRPAGGGTAR